MANEHANMNVSLPPPMRSWVDAQIAAGRYGNLSEYVRDLIRRDQERQREVELEEVLLRSMDSLDAGEGIEITPEYWERKRQEILERSRQRKTKSDGTRG